jgi:hypothetical protein
MLAINWPVVRPHIHKIAATLDEAPPGTIKAIDCGVFIPRSKPTVDQIPALPLGALKRAGCKSVSLSTL